MIAIDTSAIIAILLDEEDAASCRRALSEAESLVISAATLTECLIVARHRGLGTELELLLRKFRVQTIPLSEAAARRAADAYDIWGKGNHPARLNLADCFAFELARSQGLPLLYIGNDFDLTDIESALA